MSKKLINGKILAIQLGRNETQIALVGKNSEILHGITVATPMGAVEDGMIHNQEAIIELLKQALQTPEFKGVRQVVFSLCTSQVIMETATTPDLPRAKLEKLIQANADMYFPVDIRDYRLIWEVRDVKKNDAGTKEASVQLWAVPNEMLRPYYQTANACGLSVAAIDYCGHSAATAVGATFARPAKPPKAKAPKVSKDPDAPKEPKPKKKIDWNAEITFGKKKKVEPEITKEETGPQPVPATDMHILMDTELLGLTFVQKGQVVYQRFYRCGIDPTYQFSELAMMVEYFQTQDLGRGSEISGYVSGPGSADTDMVELLAGMLAIPLVPYEAGMDPRWLLCAGAARTTLEFGNPEFNKTVRVRRTINTDLWQYAAILASGAALVTVVMMLLNARLTWNSEVTGLENEYTILSGQAAKVKGFKENYDNYELEYEAYNRDWDNLFDSLHTYNDNLVFVLKELENVMPENTSVTDIIIDSDSVMISFACDDKEEAAYLIMSLRDMEYVDVNTISNLIGGGKGAATEYGTPIEEVTPPSEGGSLEEYSKAKYYPYVTEMAAAQKYSKVPENKMEHTSLAVFLNRHPLSVNQRIDVIKSMIDTHPFVAKTLIEKSGAYTFGEKDDISTIELAVSMYKAKLYDEASLKKAEAVLVEDTYLNGTYIHYLEAYAGLWGEIEDFEKYCPYVDEATASELAELAKTVTPDGKGNPDNYGAAWLYEWIDGCVWPQGEVDCGCVCPFVNKAYTYEPEGITAMHKVTCADCGAEQGKEACAGVAVGDTECAHCGGALKVVCKHTGTTSLKQLADEAKHEIICDICNEAIKTEVCTDGDTPDATCICGRTLICTHPEEKCGYEQISGTSTHRWYCSCGVEEIRDCRYADGICVDCGAACTHTPTHTQIVLPDGKPGHNITCACGNINDQEPCVDTSPKDKTCDICGGPINRDCKHTEKEYERVPEIFGEAFKHLSVCVCGEILPEEKCSDADGDNKCDGCKQKMSVTRKDVENLLPIYGKVPQPGAESPKDLKTFLKEKNPTYYQREAALINLFNTNAFAANSAVEPAIEMLYPSYKGLVKEDDKFETVRLGLELVMKEISGKVNPELLEKVEGVICTADSDYDLETAYLYYLEVAMGEQTVAEGEHPHLLVKDENQSDWNNYIHGYIANIQDEEGIAKPKTPNYAYLMGLYLQGNKKDAVEGVDDETLAALKTYFFEGGEGLEELGLEFDKAVTTNETIIKMLTTEFYLSKYDPELTQGKNIRTLIEDFGNETVTGNDKLLLALKKAETQAEVTKDNEQDKTLEEHEKEIEELKKQLEAMQKDGKEEEQGGSHSDMKGGDKRVFLDISLNYTDTLKEQEQQRKGLDRNAKIPKLELEVG